MNFFKRFSQGNLPLGRIEAFSDGVFAIIVTLLVLDLKVPQLKDPTDVNELAHGLVKILPQFLSWLISFIIVCKFWLNHHNIIRYAKHANYGMIWLNSLFLMFQSFVPFPTALMGQYPSNPLAVSAFGIIMTLSTLLFMILAAYITRNLIKPELDGKKDPTLKWRSLAGPVFYMSGVTMAWIYLPAAFCFYAVTPLFFITPPKMRH